MHRPGDPDDKITSETITVALDGNRRDAQLDEHELWLGFGARREDKKVTP